MADGRFLPLAGNPRLAQMLASATRRSAEQKKDDAAVFERVSANLAAGRRLSPED